jgi:hypothetical protein
MRVHLGLCPIQTSSVIIAGYRGTYHHLLTRAAPLLADSGLNAFTLNKRVAMPPASVAMPAASVDDRSVGKPIGGKESG